jgi:hypothetical protein
LHSYVSNTLAPYFKSYVKRGFVDGQKLGNSDQTGGRQSIGGANNELISANSNGLSNGNVSGSASSTSDQFASLMEKRIAEVEMGFLHLQQNIEIPEINIIIHPIVLQMIKKCSDESRKPRVDDFSDRVEDTNFLNQLQSGVSRWIREIKKVKLVFLLSLKVFLIETF